MRTPIEAVDCQLVDALLAQHSLPLDPEPSDVCRACLPHLRDGIASILTGSDVPSKAVMS